MDADGSVAVGRAVAIERVGKAARRSAIEGVFSRIGRRIASVATEVGRSVAGRVRSDAAEAAARTGSSGPHAGAAGAARRSCPGARAGRPGRGSAPRYRICARWLGLRIEIGPAGAKTRAEHEEPDDKTPAHALVSSTLSGSTSGARPTPGSRTITSSARPSPLFQLDASSA